MGSMGMRRPDGKWCPGIRHTGRHGGRGPTRGERRTGTRGGPQRYAGGSRRGCGRGDVPLGPHPYSPPARANVTVSAARSTAATVHPARCWPYQARGYPALGFSPSSPLPSTDPPPPRAPGRDHRVLRAYGRARSHRRASPSGRPRLPGSAGATPACAPPPRGPHAAARCRTPSSPVSLLVIPCRTHTAASWRCARRLVGVELSADLGIFRCARADSLLPDRVRIPIRSRPAHAAHAPRSDTRWSPPPACCPCSRRAGADRSP